MDMAMRTAATMARAMVTPEGIMARSTAVTGMGTLTARSMAPRGITGMLLATRTGTATPPGTIIMATVSIISSGTCSKARFESSMPRKCP